MELTLEAYRNIVKNVGTRADIANLCCVSRGFRRVAQRALYNTVFLRNDEESLLLCQTLTTSPHLAQLVDALTVGLSDEPEDSEDSEDEYIPPPLPPSFWPAVASALEQTTHLRYLHVQISDGSSSATSWVLANCRFQLRTFHSDFDWDANLVRFLNTQTQLEDLFIHDYREPSEEVASAPESGSSSSSAIAPAPAGTPSAASAPPALAEDSMPGLSILECTFSEAAIALVPGRPVTHLKTCFSRSEIGAKRAELNLLLSNVKLSTSSLKALDIADSSYTTSFSMELLSAVATAKVLVAELRYLGTLVLPVDGRERLQFYGLLMRFPKLQCVEFEVTNWTPPPSSTGALRALASELRLYIPSVARVVFVNDFDRSVVTAANGICRVDNDTSTELLWRERW